MIGSLWPVPNVETCLLLGRFYSELVSGDESVSPAEALRRAQLWMLQASPDSVEAARTKLLGLVPGTVEIRCRDNKTGKISPAAWAAFHVVGDGFRTFEVR